eukprot:CAMPEP_0181356324 /NCGR_PEP_ID=MMETSP1106-20121128/4363_1 /TAXON_ID=81844 /ORGANISM="Mantoniella antarctica, Strain SL-175" /LENGTH=489 /DNA_ID=CAMNT_0023469105 /DNA_START=1825 /DNA_END=3294 /DNA_ORIENTATION=+
MTFQPCVFETLSLYNNNTPQLPPKGLVCNSSTDVDLNLEVKPQFPTYMASPPPVGKAPLGENNVPAPTADPDELSTFLAELRLSAFETKLRNLGATTPNDLRGVVDADLDDMGVKPLKARQLRRGSCAMVGVGDAEALAPFLAALRLVDFAAKLADLGVATPDDLADVDDLELAEMGVKPLKMRHLRRVLCAAAPGGGKQGADELAWFLELASFLQKLQMDDCAEKLREFGVATPRDLAEVEDTELAEMGIMPLKVRQLRKASILSDEDILRLWRDQCPALQTLWPAEKPVMRWKGLTFANTDAFASTLGWRVVKIRMSGKLGDVTEMPAELGRLTELTHFDIENNQLTSVPAELGRLTALTKLSLDGNQLTSVPAELGRLTALTSLWLSKNQLTSLPAELGRLTALTELDLHKNQLTSVPAQLGRLTALTDLRLQGNKLSSVPAELGRLSALTYLDLSEDQLISLPAEWKPGAALEKSGCFIHRIQRN